MAELKYDIYKGKDGGLLRIDVSGTLSRSGVMKMVTAAREQAYRENLNLLYDMRTMDLPDDILLSEILTFVRTHASLNSAKANSVRSASLVVKQLLSDEVWEVYQYASRNAGLEWEFFTEEQKAIDWLRSSEPT
jgi:hypothetical protein